MSRSKFQAVPVGRHCLDVGTWNPATRGGEQTFSYIDIGALDQGSKAIRAISPIPCDQAPSRARQLVRSGDILVSTVRPNLNAVAVVPDGLDGATASTGFCVLRPDPNHCDGRYLFHWVRSPIFIEAMVRLATGASYPAVSDRIVKESVLPLPPLPEQRRIAAILDQAEALRAKRRAALAKLDPLAHSIFIEMFGDPVTNPKQWSASTTLGDVAEIVSGITIGRNLKGLTVREVPYLAVVNVQDREIRLDVLKTTEATEAEIARYQLKKNDLLLTEGGDPDKLGRGSLWHEEIPECIHQNHVFRVRLTSQTLHPLFLNWLVGSRRGKNYFLRSAKQTTGIASINMTQLRGFPLLLPPQTLQQEFVNRMELLDQMKAGNRNSLAHLDDLISALQHRAFRGEL